MFSQPPRGIVAKKSGIIPYPEGHRFFLYKAFKLDKNPSHLRHRCSNPGKQFIRTFVPKRNLFGNFIPLFPWEQVDNGREENCSFFENFSSQFSEKMLKAGIFNNRGIIKLPRINRFAFATLLAVDIGPSVRFAIQRTHKNSTLV